MALSAFLLDRKTTLVKALRDSEPIRIVSGNEAADLDSFASAVLFSYFSRTHDGEPPIVPLFPIVRRDLRLRLDIVYLLERNGIEVLDVPFLDDLPETTNSQISWILVDHNVPEQILTSISPNWTVTGIIDHHEDSGLYPDADPRVITPAGSCTSLVTNFFDAVFSPNLDVAEIQLARVAIAAIAVDTSGLRKKVTVHDEMAVGVLRAVLELVGEDVDIIALGKDLKKRRKNVAGLSLRDLLRKDYKQFPVAASPSEDSDHRIGISSIPVSIKHILHKFSVSELDDAVLQWAEERQLSLAFIMTHFHHHHRHHRELVIWAPDNAPDAAREFAGSLKETKEGRKLDLQDGIGELNSIEGFRWAFRQGNVEASRKQVAPALVKELTRAVLES